MISRDDDNPFVKVTHILCANAPACAFPAQGQDSEGRWLCQWCSKIERERMARWIKAGKPTQAESMAKIRATLKRTPKWQTVGSWQSIGAIKERVPGEDDE